jgi:hypothetical protein
MRTIMITLALVAACKSKGDSASSDKSPAVTTDIPPSHENNDESGGTGTAMALDEGKMGKKDSDRAEGQYRMKASGGAPAPAAAPEPPKTDQPAKKKPAAPDKTASNESATRSWFPETFLFEPLLVTDGQGAASYNVLVPDRLTTWRVLALAHSRTGAQGGAVASFLGTLAVYVDPIVPKVMMVGDEVRVPIQVVNTTAAPVGAALATTATNVKVAGGNGARTVPAQGSVVDYATITADRPGPGKLKVAIGTDAVERSFELRPTGRPVVITRSGTLAAPRTLSIEGPAGSDPRTDKVRLRAFPGALAILRNELGVSIYRDKTANDAYALLLAGRAPELLAKLGDKPDPVALRELSIIAGQRAIHDGRTLGVTSASLLAEAALAHGQNPVLSRLGERAVGYLTKNQRPDGTFGGGDGYTLQRVLVTTAEATRAVQVGSASPDQKQRAMAVATRARGAFERNFARIEDPYTAAAILATGALQGDLADKLKAKVLAGIKGSDDGAKYLDVGSGVVRPDGLAPSRVEATAFAVLALAGDPKAPLADLGATLLGAYNVQDGWGDGRANLAAMRAVLELFKAPMPDSVKITLTMDGKAITEGTLTRDKVREVLVLEADAPGIAGTHEWKVTAEPAVPGLGYALELDGWVPWPKEKAQGGLELAIVTPPGAAVGKPSELALNAIAPSGVEVTIELALPAGVQPDVASIEALVSAKTISRYTASEGNLELVIPPLPPGQTFAAKLRVIPTLGGKLHAPASSIRAEGHDYFVPPAEWIVH